ERYRRYNEKRRLIEQEKERVENTRVRPDMQHVQEVLRAAGSPELTEVIELAQLLRRPEINYSHIVAMAPAPEVLPDDVTEQVEIQIKYDGYIKKS
ncbi:tRNA uridine-5-carboxymethylaminomethyl(34) synthesis enzyme MnmG, partial [Mesorhizobium sp. M00.F.Ca.ET.186.01.1.1]